MKTADGTRVDATGGGPADLTDSIYLCSRSDSDQLRCVCLCGDVGGG